MSLSVCGPFFPSPGQIRFSFVARFRGQQRNSAENCLSPKRRKTANSDRNPNHAFPPSKFFFPFDDSVTFLVNSAVDRVIHVIVVKRVSIQFPRILPPPPPPPPPLKVSSPMWKHSPFCLFWHQPIFNFSFFLLLQAPSQRAKTPPPKNYLPPSPFPHPGSQGFRKLLLSFVDAAFMLNPKRPRFCRTPFPVLIKPLSLNLYSFQMPVDVRDDQSSLLLPCSISDSTPSFRELHCFQRSIETVFCVPLAAQPPHRYMGGVLTASIFPRLPFLVFFD